MGAHVLAVEGVGEGDAASSPREVGLVLSPHALGMGTEREDDESTHPGRDRRAQEGRAQGCRAPRPAPRGDAEPRASGGQRSQSSGTNPSREGQPGTAKPPS